MWLSSKQKRLPNQIQSHGNRAAARDIHIFGWLKYRLSFREQTTSCSPPLCNSLRDSFKCVMRWQRHIPIDIIEYQIIPVNFKSITISSESKWKINSLWKRATFRMWPRRFHWLCTNRSRFTGVFCLFNLLKAKIITMLKVNCNFHPRNTHEMKWNGITIHQWLAVACLLAILIWNLQSKQ